MRKTLFLLIMLLNFFVVNANENSIKEIRIYKVPYIVGEVVNDSIVEITVPSSVYSTEESVLKSSESEITIIHRGKNIKDFKECLDETELSEKKFGFGSVMIVIEWYGKHDVKLGSCCINRRKLMRYNHNIYKCDKLLKYIADHVTGFVYDENSNTLQWMFDDPSDIQKLKESGYGKKRKLISSHLMNKKNKPNLANTK